MRFAYIQEIYPQNGETWIRYEMDELARQSHTVRLYVTWPRPINGPPVNPSIERVYVTEQSPARVALSGGHLRPALPHVLRLLRASPHPRWTLRVLRAVSQASAVVRDFLTFRPDLVVCHFAGNRALLGSILAQAAQLPYVMVMHAGDVWRRSPGHPALVQTAHEVWTISQFNVTYLHRHYPDIDWSSLRLVRVGINLAEFPFTPTMDVGQHELVFVARLAPGKGVDTLLHACALLAHDNWTFEVSILGDGPQRAEMEALAGRLGLGRQVHFRGSVPSVVVRDHLRRAAAFVLPCRREGAFMDGIPVAVMEAMATGTPVVTTAVSGIPELIKDGENGVLVDPDDPAALAAGIRRVWKLPRWQRLQLVEQARATVDHRHDVRLVATELVELASRAGAGVLPRS